MRVEFPEANEKNILPDWEIVVSLQHEINNQNINNRLTINGLDGKK